MALRSPESRPRWNSLAQLPYSSPENSTADGVPPSDGSLDGEEENEGSESGLDLDCQSQPCRYASALCEETEDTFEFEEEALRELEDSLQLIRAREDEALGELEDVLSLVRQASDKGTDLALISAKQDELVKQLQDLDITFYCEGNDGDAVKMKGLAALPALLGGKIFLRNRPVQEEPMRPQAGKTRKGARGAAKCQQRQKVKVKQRCADVGHARPEISNLHWPERCSRIKVDETQVLTKPGMWPSSLFSCAACFT